MTDPDRIEVHYRFAQGVDAAKHAQVIAVGQTAGTWDARFAHRESYFERHLGRVIDVTDADEGRSIATISFPVDNTEGDIATLLTMIFGKYSMAGAAKVVDVRLPDEYGVRPKLGIDGIRERLEVADRPLVMAIFKPALGLSAEDHANILREVAGAGIDIVKDDEILGNLDVAPTHDRLAACHEVIEAHREATGRTVLYALNLTGPATTILERAEQYVEAGANALLLNVLSYGFPILESLAANPSVDVPIFAHPALAGAWCAAPDHGFAYSVVLGTLMAHAGADAVLYPAHYGSLPFDEKEEARIRDALRARNVFPVPSAGIHPGVVPRARADYGDDVILNAGTGIMDHPDGPGAGVRAFFEALDTGKTKGSFELSDIPEGPLRRALEKWGTHE